MSSRGKAGSGPGPIDSVQMPDVVVPQSLGEVLQLLRHTTDRAVWAGGTWWLHQPESARRDRQILAIHSVRELRRVVRTGHHVEIGATVPAGRLLGAGRRFLPALAVEAIHRVGPPPVRNVATLGGALAIPGTTLPVTAVLQLIDTSIELRRQGNSRWMSLGHFRDPTGVLRIDEGEIITRLRIPLRNWTHWMIHTYGQPFPGGGPSLTLLGAASMDKTGIDEFRFALLINGKRQIRLRAAETDLVGKAVPLTERDRRTILGSLEDNLLFGSELDDLGRWRASNGLRGFLQKLQ
ncbi:MAG TPA: FAD binding domain-containing protein [Alkalispirochaeta sp.]|nr:FAD binding domain-containing protein [Alkalispirochaeta sp.]